MAVTDSPIKIGPEKSPALVNQNHSEEEAMLHVDSHNKQIW